MVRNESDILPSSLAHCAALFDHIVVMDHRSTDPPTARARYSRRRALPASRSSCSTAVRGNVPAAITNLLVQRAFAAGADWVFPLDANECVDITDRHTLEAVLEAQARGARRFAWRNVAPDRQGSWGHFDVKGDYLCPARPSVWSKVVLSRAVADHYPGFWLSLGNHEISPEQGMATLELPTAGEYLHIRIRSRDRLYAKLENGGAAYRALGRAKPAPRAAARRPT
ncbi:glycosyltransferase family 2 protein [Acidisphaera sp. S103]|uniref:glycosyltransferase family 2 protein n=1 Tax=Acidisphaera sp. S103 TaxID=1747223 RepID=UPI00131C1F57|nr:glycosyltransferase family 2 protein [Acidisphaera sp. S103]